MERRPAGLLVVLACCLFAAGLARAAQPQPALSLTVEFPDGHFVRTSVGAAECAGECAWYNIGGYLQAAFHKAGLQISEHCTGVGSRRGCHITAIGGVANSKGRSWVMFRNGVRNAYPYNQILHDSQPQWLVYRFIPSSKSKP